MKTIGLSKISVRFGDVQALSDVTFKVEAGEVVMLAGPNGAGKSTLLQVLLGLVRPDCGSVVSNNEQISIGSLFKQKLGYLPESVSFSSSLTAQMVMNFFARARGVGRTRVRDVLKFVGLFDARNRPVGGFSKGMRQRLGLGVAIMAEPQLLVLDEPTAALDHQGLKVFYEVLDDWRSKGRMVLLTSHDITLMEQRVDKICILKAGEIAAWATPEELRKRYALPALVSLRVENSFKAERLDELFNGQVKLESSLGSHIQLKVHPSKLLDLTKWVAKYQGEIKEIGVRDAQMERVYERVLELA
ncbi:MAG: ABC transporter ATP-binding protein [Deltaproteobacteria bacterium]|jgi:Cu-processing system ATP-binding protein|nr:ABC transporter ATP-binding protein [Deltaproteobacteria bacterium]